MVGSKRIWGEVERRLTEVRRKWKSFRKECLKQVVLWRWATYFVVEEAPLDLETHGSRPGRWLGEKSRGKGWVEYGFDATNRMVVRRCKDIGDESYFVQAAQYVDRVSYSRSSEEAVLLERSYYEKGLLRESYFCALREDDASFRRGLTTYDYDGNRLVRRVGREEDVVEVYAYSYSKDGALESIRRAYADKVPPDYIPKKFTETMYDRAMAKRKSVADLEPALDVKLTAAILKAVASANLSGRAYCLAIAYDLEASSFVPMLALGLEEERAGWLQKHGKAAKGYMWNPAEFSMFENGKLDLRDTELQRLSSTWSGFLIGKGRTGQIATFLSNVAARLAGRKSPGTLKTTPDFVVYATDLELVDLNKNMKISVPPARLAEFKKKGWL